MRYNSIESKMKTRFSLYILFVLTVKLVAAQQQSAGEYLSYINNEQARISNDLMQYISAANHGKERSQSGETEA